MPAPIEPSYAVNRSDWRRGPAGLPEWMDRLNPTIAELSHAIAQEVEKCPQAQRLMTHPGVGALTALALC